MGTFPPSNGVPSPTNLATGPYPGTFTETGLLTFDATGHYTVSADFQIFNSTGALTVTGHKVGSGAGTCSLPNRFLASPTTVSYTAQTPAGPDRGTSTFAYTGQLAGPGGFNNFNGPLSEVFTSTAPPPPGCNTNGHGNGNDQCNQ